jgi:hypothetical protein
MNWSEEQFADYQNKKGITPEPQKKAKYSNNRVKIDGFLFDSQLEANYYGDLKIQLRAGVIRGFCRQPRFILTTGGNGLEPMEYVADFIVWRLDGTAEIIDTKGFETDLFIAKKKVFAEKFPRLELKIEGA